MDSQREAVEIRLGAELAAIGTVTAAVEPAVELEMNVLRKFSAAQFALVRFFPRVQAQVCFQVAGAAETLVTNLETEQNLSESLSQLVLFNAKGWIDLLALRLSSHWHSVTDEPQWSCLMELHGNGPHLARVHPTSFSFSTSFCSLHPLLPPAPCPQMLERTD